MNPKNPFADPEHPIDYNIRGKDLVERVIQAAPKPEISSLFSIDDTQGFIRVNGVKYGNGIYTVDLDGYTALEACSQKNIEQWFEYTSQARSRGGFGVGSMPLYFAFFDALYQNRNDPRCEKQIKMVQLFLQNVLGSRSQFMTMSSISFGEKNSQITPKLGCHLDPEGKKDHFEGFPASRGYFHEFRSDAREPLCKSIFGNEDYGHVDAVHQWLVEYPTMVDFSPFVQPEKPCAVVFGKGDQHVGGGPNHHSFLTLATSYEAQHIALGIRATKTK